MNRLKSISRVIIGAGIAGFYYGYSPAWLLMGFWEARGELEITLVFVSLGGRPPGIPAVQNQTPDEDEEFFDIKEGLFFWKEPPFKG